MPKLNWQSLDDIAIALYEKFPDQDPTHVRFTDLHKWITELPGFAGDPMKSETPARPMTPRGGTVIRKRVIALSR